MKPVFVLNGPNLNMLGLREPEIYGRETLDEFRRLCVAGGTALGLSVDFRQTNIEGELVSLDPGGADRRVRHRNQCRRLHPHVGCHSRRAQGERTARLSRCICPMSTSASPFDTTASCRLLRLA